MKGERERERKKNQEVGMATYDQGIRCDVCGEKLTPEGGYIYGCHAACVKLALRMAREEFAYYRYMDVIAEEVPA